MSNTLDILDCAGTKVGEYIVPDSAIENEKGTQAVHDAVVAFLAGCRAGTASTKTRGEVCGGGAKPFRQKGRGAARAGSSRNPVWTGGGVAFGPKPRSFAKKINKKVLALALKRAFSERLAEGSIIVLDKFALPDHKTKSATAVLKALKVAEESVLLTVPELDEAVVCATGNLANLLLRTAVSVNTYELLLSNKLIFTKDALDSFIERLA